MNAGRKHYAPTVLIFVSRYLPGYKSGGPIRSIANIVESLGDEFNFLIVTSDRDASDSESYPDLPQDGAWKVVGKARVMYLPPNRMGMRHIAKLLRTIPHDVLYLNSFFNPIFTLKPLLVRKLWLEASVRCVVAPRGEFSVGALKLKSFKKKLFIFAANMVGLYRDVVWHASSDNELSDIKRGLGDLAGKGMVAINLPAFATPLQNWEYRKEGDPVRICFLSRISPMKNLDFAINILSNLDIKADFDIYGPIGDRQYWEKCLSLIREMPNNIVVNYYGSISHHEVPSALNRYDLFFLPTRGENYGHAIFEALSVGTPVLISDQTPWQDLVDRGLGWDIPLDQPHSFIRAILEIEGWSRQQIIARRNACREFSANHRGSEVLCTAMRAVLAPGSSHSDLKFNS